MEVIMNEATQQNGQSYPKSGESANNGDLVTDNQQQQQQQQQSFLERNGATEMEPILKSANKNQPVDLEFINIKYKATVGGFLGYGSTTKEILHGVYGRFPSGQLIAIMGPSGAGKSTLLDVLSGYRINGISGTVKVNGQKRNMAAFRRLSCYITQDDRLQGLLTVQENMQIAADLKLPAEVSKKEKLQIIKNVLDVLGLAKAKDTKAGGLSGGQKKRLSIALELITDPQILFLDEPTTGLDSSSCSQCIQLLQNLARQGKTIICTIHQPSATLFKQFDQVYVLAGGNCLYQGDTQKLVPFFDDAGFPCPMYNNPADFVIELACEEYGRDKVDKMISMSENGKSLKYFKDNGKLLKNYTPSQEDLIGTDDNSDLDNLQATSKINQLKVLLRRGYIKAKRDQTLTYLRVAVNVIVGMMLGTLYWNAGNDGSKVIDNYNLLFSILMHHMFSTMMLTILTFPADMFILIKEHFNRWYSLKMYYLATTIIDLPISIVCCALFSGIIYYMTSQPMEMNRFLMFFVTSQLSVFVAQSFGLMIGAYFDVVNGTFLGPTLAVPMMMFAGFGVSLKDLPRFLYWGSYISYLRFSLEGVVGAVYGLNRGVLDCPEDLYCHYKYPKKFLEDVDVKVDQFGNDVVALVLFVFLLRTAAFVILKLKLKAVR